jgi:5-amino-6-(5-phosphoribosylamino)uracil reductase
MRIIVSAAVSLDGFLADSGSQRLLLSSEADLAAVYRLRAESDAILVGAETVRRDDPSLATRHADLFELRRLRGAAPHPIKAVITRSGDLPPGSRFFSDGDATKLVFCASRTVPALEQRLGSRAVVVPVAEETATARSVVTALTDRGVSQLMIEGGARTIELFLREGLVDTIRLAIAPVVCGARGTVRLFTDAAAQLAERGRIVLARVESWGDTAVLWYELERGGGDVR